jgi:hypothetical protein
VPFRGQADCIVLDLCGLIDIFDESHPKLGKMRALQGQRWRKKGISPRSRFTPTRERTTDPLRPMAFTTRFGRRFLLGLIRRLDAAERAGVSEQLLLCEITS